MCHLNGNIKKSIKYNIIILLVCVINTPEESHIIKNKSIGLDLSGVLIG